MVNRTELLNTLEPIIEPTATEREKLRNQLDRVLVQLSLSLPFEAVTKLSKEAKDDLGITIRDLYQPADVKKLAKKWEPKRRLLKPDDELKDSLQQDLIDLLYNRRPKYEGVTLVSIQDAQQDLDFFHAYITKVLPTSDAKKLLRFWNKKLKPFPKTRDDTVDNLLKLLKSSAPASDKAA